MTILDAVADDDDDDLSALAPAAAPVLPIDYEPAEARIIWESHPDGETFTDPFSVWRTLVSIGQWGGLLAASVVHFAVMQMKESAGS
jgi:hypothetical protein